MPEVTYLSALFAGLLSFLTPCILPMVPFYLGYMGGLSMGELRATNGITPGARRRLVASAVAFAFGVTTIFVLLGLGATTIGGLLATWQREASLVAAAVLAIFGLHFIGVLRVPLLYRQARVNSTADASSLGGAYLMGLAFGFGWTPCVGPALSAVLFVAAGMEQVWQGGALLLVYGLGMTLPFVIASLFVMPFLRWADRHRERLRMVETVMGVMLLIFAALIATDSVARIAEWMLRTFPVFLNWL